MYKISIAILDPHEPPVTADELTTEGQAASDSVCFLASGVAVMGTLSLMAANFAFFAAATGVQGYAEPPPPWSFIILGVLHCAVVITAASTAPFIRIVFRRHRLCKIAAKLAGQEPPRMFNWFALRHQLYAVAMFLFVFRMCRGWINPVRPLTAANSSLEIDFLFPIATFCLVYWFRKELCELALPNVPGEA